MSDEPSFAGEDENAGYASPRQDLIASAVLGALCIWVMVESVRLAVPGSWATAPGLLPFITAASLLLMALALAYLAIRRIRAGENSRTGESPGEFKRTALLFGLVGIYLLGLQTLGFDYTTEYAGVTFGVGIFELLTTILLFVILVIFWGANPVKCGLVAVLWTFALAGVFRYIFETPLPGTL